MWQGTERPTRVRFEYTRFAHMGRHSGYAQLARHFDPTRFDVVAHGASDSDADFPRWLKPARPALKRLIARGGMPWYKLSDLDAEARAFFGCLVRRHDVVHFLEGEHSARFLPRAARFACLNGLRIVATFHQPPELAAKLLNVKLLRRLDGVVLMASSQRAFFDRHVDGDRIRVIPLGVDTEFFRPAATRAPGNRIHCVTVGHWLRDWKTFAAVAAAAPEIQFSVVCGQQPELEKTPNVRILKNIDDLALVELYRAADILFLPLVDSTANNALLEGMACGLPVLATDLQATRACLPNGEGILVPDNRVDGFMAGLRALRSDPGLRQELGRRSRRRAEELAWPRLVSQYEQFYAQALARPSAGVG